MASKFLRTCFEKKKKKALNSALHLRQKLALGLTKERAFVTLPECCIALRINKDNPLLRPHQNGTKNPTDLYAFTKNCVHRHNFTASLSM